MSDDPWYTAFFGPDYRQTRAIQRVAGHTGLLEDRIDSLQRENDRLEETVRRLDAVVRVLGSHLVTRGIIDGDQIARELKQALAPDAPGGPQAPGSPYRGAVPVKVVPPTVACDGCSLEVLRESTQFTEGGALCEACFRAAEIERLSKIESE